MGQRIHCVNSMLIQLEYERYSGAESYLGVVNTGKLCATDLALLHKCYNA